VSGLAIVVPGHSRRGRVSARALRLVRAAAALADERDADLVVFSGAGEAEEMRAAWAGRADVETVVEPTARTTAENAARTLPLLLERGVDRVLVVCGPAHAPRVRYLFRGIFGPYGVDVTVLRVGLAPHPAAVGRELVAAGLAPRHRRAATTELESLIGG
jgi:uncharacterized SAM-binding protein YcdF (DUF218 family)